MKGLTDKQKKKLVRLATVADDGEVGLLAEINDLEDKLDDTAEKLTKEVSEVREELTGKIENIQLLKGDEGKPGVDGKDYILTLEDKEEIAQKIEVPIVEKVIERTEVIRETPIVTEVTKVTNEIKEIAIAMKATELRDKLEALRDEDRFDIAFVKGVDKLLALEVQFLKDWSIQILDQRTSFLIQKVSNLSDKVNTAPPGSVSIGGTITGATEGSVLFAGVGGVLAQDNANFFWDDTLNILKIGNGTSTFSNAGGTGSVVSTMNGGNSFYVPFSGQNLNAGTTASTDIILGSNNATDSTNYLDIGINSSGNTDANYTAFTAGGAYIYNQSQALSIGTAANKPLYLFTGGTLFTNIRMTILGTGLVGIGTLNPANNFVVTAPGSNAGFEIAVGSSITMGSYNRTTSLYTGLTFDALGISFRPAALGSKLVRFVSPIAVSYNSAVTGLELDWSTNVTPGSVSVTGEAILLPSVTAANSNTYKGVFVTQTSLVSTGAGVSTFVGYDLQMPAITQSNGTLNSIGLRIVGGTVTSGTAKAITTDAAAGDVEIGANIIASGAASTFRLKGFTVATLPGGVVGDTAYVTDALAPAYGVAVAGGGAVVIPVFRNATVWICA